MWEKKTTHSESWETYRGEVKGRRLPEEWEDREKEKKESRRRRDTYQKEKKEKALDEEEKAWSGLEPLNNNNIHFMLEGRSTAASPQSIKKRNSIFSILNAHFYWLQSSPWRRLWFFFFLLLPDGQKLFSSQYCLLDGELRLLILICPCKHASGSLDGGVKMVGCPPRTWINDAANFSWSPPGPPGSPVGNTCDRRRRPPGGIPVSAALRIRREYLCRIRVFLPRGGAARSAPPSKGPTFSTRLNRRQTGEGEVWADPTVPFVTSLEGKVLEFLLLFFHFWQRYRQGFPWPQTRTKNKVANKK